MPYSVGDGELRVVASQKIGELGPSSGSPVVFHWRWYYHFPDWSIWATMLVLVIVPRANRHRQAWLILLPLGLVLLVWRMPLMLLGFPDDTTEKIGFIVAWVAVGWTMVWLLGHWLKNRYRTVTFFLALGLMLVVGLWSCYCHIDLENSDSWFTVTMYGMSVVVMLVATIFNTYFCRNRCTLRRFLGWLILWNSLAAFLAFLAFAG